MKKRIIAATAVVAALAIASLAGCATNSGSNASSSSSSDSEATTVLVGTNANPAPFGWVNDDGTLDGYDYAVIDAIDELLPQYEFELENVEFPSIFTGLDSGRYQMAANNLSWTAERAEKYLFTDNYYIYNKTAVAFKKGRTDIKGIDDLGGKKSAASDSGDAFQLFLEKYNENNPDNKIDIQYSDALQLDKLRLVEKGELDFFVLEQAQLQEYLDNYGLEVDYINLSKEDSYGQINPEGYFLFSKTDEGEQLKADVDEAIKTLKDNGTLSKIAEEYFGFDIFSNDDGELSSQKK